MYQSYYNLTGKPFRLSPDPSFFFPSRGHKRALAYLRYGLHQNEGFVVITGAPGTGKTTLAQILLEELGDKNIVVAHLTTTQLEADDMLRMVAASFGLRYENLDKAALLKTIESFLLARSREGKRALLVVDEAQNLPARSLEELRMLSNLQIGDKALLQTFLLGQIQFRNMLDNPDLEQLRQRVIANFHLSPLAADESQRYIESRLKHVNWNNDPHFAEIAFEKIHEFTEGVPRRINMLCDRILLFGCMEETHNVTGELVNQVRKELEQEVSSGTVSSKTKADNTPVEAPQSNDEPSYNAAASFNATSQLAEELKNVTSKRMVADDHAAKPELAENQSKATTTQSRSILSGRSEPQMPHAIDSEDEEFIDITKDFIDAFDKSVSLSDDDSEENEKSLINKSSAKVKTTQGKPKASTKANKPSKQEAKKTVAKPTEQTRDKPVLAKEPEQEAVDQDVLGNTVKRKHPAELDIDDEPFSISLTPEPPPQVSERELFRVIPGGKNKNADNAPAEKSNLPIAPAAMASPTSEDVVLRRILRLVLAFHRSPSSFPGLDDPIQPLPEGVSELLELAVSDDQVLTKVSPAAVMGISPVMLRSAVRFFIRRTLFAAKGDYYRTLGLQSNASVADIERHYDLLMRLLRQDKQSGAAECVDRVGRAYEELMRLDDSPASSEEAVEEDSDTKAAQVLEALENPDLTIDFSQEIKTEEKPTPVSAYLGAVSDSYTPDPRITRRRIHLLGQAAILGIGALVIVLGIFITQLEPSDTGETAQTTSADVTEVDPIVIPQERRRGLAFNDGSVEDESEVESSSSVASVKNDDRTKVVEEEPVSVASTAPVVKPVEKKKPPVKASAKSDAPKPVVIPKQEVKVAESVPVQEFKPSTSTSSAAKKETAATSTVAAETVATTKVPSDTETKSVLTKAAPVAVVAGAAAVTESSATSTKSASKFSSVPVEQKSPTGSSEASTLDKPTAPPESPISVAAQQNKFEGKDIPISTTSPSAVAVVPVMPKGSQAQGEPPAQVSGDAVKTAPVKIAKIEPIPLAAQSISEITEPKLNQFLVEFSKAFEKGELNNLMALFTETARTSTQTTRNAIESEYRKLFSASASRNMTMVASTWDNEGQFARGVGEYSTVVTPKGGSPISVKGEYTMQLQLIDDKIRVSRFYLSNEIPASSLKSTPTGPSSTELKALLSSFTEFYENGDVDRLMNLFTGNAQTNDQNTLAGIRQDHVDLFNVTQARQMFLKDMKWQTKGNIAIGKGNFEVMVQNQGQDSFATVAGTVTVEATRTPGGVKISKFFHKTNQ